MTTQDILQDAHKKAVEINAGELIHAGFLPKSGLIFPAILYPPAIKIAKKCNITEDQFFADYKATGPFVIYVHIPFCVNRCNFCHFVTKTGSPSEQVDLYLNAIEQEMDLYLKRLSLTKIPTAAILIGGGTATNMTPRQMERFLAAFTKRLDLSCCEQFTIDTDPTTILGADGEEKLETLVRFGADRITIGAQNFDNAILKKMNRAHTAEEIKIAVKSAREHGFNNISVDLIYGYPGQTLEGWIDTVQQALELDVDAFQAFELRVYSGSLIDGPTPVHFHRSPGDFPGVDERTSMKAGAILVAEEHGYYDGDYNYLFSKKTGMTSQYQEKRSSLLYDTLAFGMSAQSVLGGSIAINEFASMARYCSEVAEGRIPLVRGKTRTLDDILRRTVISTLRTRRFLSKDEYQKRTGRDINDVFGKKINALKKYGLLTEDEENLRLTERGYYFADTLCMQFHHPDFLPFERNEYHEGELNPYNN